VPPPSQPGENQPPPLPAAHPITSLDLAASRKTALAKQPAIAAARASLDAAYARVQALDDLHVPHFLARDLPVRKQQAALGVIIAEAGVREAEINTVYGVTYAYLGYLYAQAQVQVVRRSLENLDKLQKRIDPQRDLKPRPPTAPEKNAPQALSREDVDLINVYRGLARGRREEALAGAARALRLLREELGVGPDCPVCVAQADLLEVNVPVDCQKVVGLALERRPELVITTHAHQVHDFEAAAQDARRCALRAPTFASGSDIHSHPIPAATYGGNFRPGALAPEMPVTLNGPRCDRVNQAHVYGERASVVAVKTRNLIALEAELAYLRWAEATKKVAEYRKAFHDANDLVEKFRQGLINVPSNARFRELLETAVLATQLNVQINEARFQLLVALAELERVTAGGFCPGLEGAPAIPDEPKKKKDNNGNSNGNSAGKQQK
jgi:hypothetical protein